MPDDAAQILSPDHPFLAESARDLVTLVHHPEAGLFVISGWRIGRKPLSFPSENGAHGGPGPYETAGFALLPAGTPLPEARHVYLRPDQLRQAAREVLKLHKVLGQQGVVRQATVQNNDGDHSQLLPKWQIGPFLHGIINRSVGASMLGFV